MNKLQWDINQNTKLFIHKNVFEKVVCEMETILFRGRRVKTAVLTPLLLNKMASISQMTFLDTQHCGYWIPYSQGPALQNKIISNKITQLFMG